MKLIAARRAFEAMLTIVGPLGALRQPRTGVMEGT